MIHDGSRSPVALVTGAASGIGAASAAELRARGWLVAGLDLRAPDGVDLAADVDVSDADDVTAAVRRVTAELGQVRAVVAAAGHYETTAVSAIAWPAWQRMLRVHLGGFANVARAVLPGMVEAGTGTLVAVASELAIGGSDDGAHYAAAKGAVLGLVRSLAVEYAHTGVRVNAVAPGPTDTPLLPDDARAPGYLATLPARRLTTPAEIALTVGFLVEEATYSTGEVVSPNAGAVI